MKKTIMMALVLLLPLGAYGETLEKDSFACLSRPKLDEFYTLLAKHDMRGAQYLLGNGCIQTNQSVDVSVLNTHWDNSAKVRLYTASGAAVVWVKERHIH